MWVGFWPWTRHELPVVIGMGSMLLVASCKLLLAGCLLALQLHMFLPEKHETKISIMKRKSPDDDDDDHEDDDDDGDEDGVEDEDGHGE